jgi:hypothetical protein
MHRFFLWRTRQQVPSTSIQVHRSVLGTSVVRQSHVLSKEQKQETRNYVTQLARELCVGRNWPIGRCWSCGKSVCTPVIRCLHSTRKAEIAEQRELQLFRGCWASDRRRETKICSSLQPTSDPVTAVHTLQLLQLSPAAAGVQRARWRLLVQYGRKMCQPAARLGGAIVSGVEVEQEWTQSEFVAISSSYPYNW